MTSKATRRLNEEKSYYLGLNGKPPILEDYFDETNEPSSIMLSKYIDGILLLIERNINPDLNPELEYGNIYAMLIDEDRMTKYIDGLKNPNYSKLNNNYLNDPYQLGMMVRMASDLSDREPENITESTNNVGITINGTCLNEEDHRIVPPKHDLRFGIIDKTFGSIHPIKRLQRFGFAARIKYVYRE